MEKKLTNWEIISRWSSSIKRWLSMDFFPSADFIDSLLMPKTECVSWKGEHKFFSFSFTQIGSEIAFEELNECGAIKTIIIQLAAMGAATSYRWFSHFTRIPSSIQFESTQPLLMWILNIDESMKKKTSFIFCASSEWKEVIVEKCRSIPSSFTLFIRNLSPLSGRSLST